MKRFKAIAAMSKNRVIGCQGKIPWHLPDDFRWFKQATTGQIVVMGRKTFESIGKLLPNRETIVLSRSCLSIPGARVVRDLDELLAVEDSRDIFICGGAEVYAQTLPFCSDLYLTVVNRIVDVGDAFFPGFEHLFAFEKVVLETPEFAVRHYQRRAGD